MSFRPAVEVVICVHNALEDVRACVESVLRARRDPTKEGLILVDDGSGLETETYLAELASLPGVQVLRSASATGYTKAANRGLRHSAAETIVLLNSDTIVSEGWVSKLQATLDYSPDIGMVGPLSNAASWQSVPQVLNDDGKFAVNSLPSNMSLASYDRAIEFLNRNVNLRPRVPLLNGFCIMLKREVLNKIGYLDEVSFPKGYGEENDFCFRAGDAGFGLLVAIDTFVFHAKSASYGTATRDALAAEGGKAFRNKFPQDRIARAVNSMRANPILHSVRNEVSSIHGDIDKKALVEVEVPRTLDSYLSTNAYDHIDFGCSKGGSLQFGKDKLGGRRGLGIDLSPAKVKQTQAAGFDACVADATKLSQHLGVVRFVTMLDFLEHLPSVHNAKECITAACAAATDFVYIRQPWFDSDGFLFAQKLKLYWSDWAGHPNAMTSLEFHNILRHVPGVHRWRLFGVKRIEDSSHHAVHPLISPKDQGKWEASVHPPKPQVTFSQPVYTQLACIIETSQQGLPAIVEANLSRYETLFDSREMLRAAA